MIKSIFKLIHDLRIFFFAIILVSFLYNIGVNPVVLGKFIGAKIGMAVGVSTSTSVPQNPFNSVALQLAEKERMLQEKESQLNRREEGLAREGIFSQKFLVYFLSIGIIVLFGLIILNYYLDYRRRSQKK